MQYFNLGEILSHLPKMPPRVQVPILETKQILAMLKASYWYCLGYYINWIVMSTNLAHNSVTSSNNSTNKMMSNINMLYSLMEHMIFCKEDGTLNVTKDGSNVQVFTKLAEQSLHPNNFLVSLCRHL